MAPRAGASAPLPLILVALLLGFGLACGPPEPRLESVKFVDLPVPAMFRIACAQTRQPYVLELPPRSIDGRFDLALTDVTMKQALDAMVALDPQFQHGIHGEVLLMLPSREADLDASPFEKRMPRLSVTGGAGEVLRRLLVEGGLADGTNLTVETAGLRRPVTLEMEDVRIRDAFAEVASQAHLALIIEPGSVSVLDVPQ